MKKILFCILMFSAFCNYSQFMQEYDSIPVQKDTIVYHKNSSYKEMRTFTSSIKETYSGKDFEYTEAETEQPEEHTNWGNAAFLQGLLFFISKIFPFVLGAIIIIIVLKAFLGVQLDFWNVPKKNMRNTTSLVYEDEDINQVDLEGLLHNAIENQEYRQAIRYCYLISLKQLSDKKLITYHKDKTNSEYLFEIENTATRQKFSYLSYIFNYVWYGEFSVNESDFRTVESKYQSFKKGLK